MEETFRFERFKGADLLEVGVGLGTDHVWLGRAGARLTGVDLTPRCVELVRRRLEQEGIAGRVEVMAAEKLAFPDDSFDVVYSFGVLHHLPRMDAGVAEIRRVLRPGGALVGAVYSKESIAFARIAASWLISWPLHRRSLNQHLSTVVEYGGDGAKPLVRVLRRKELVDLLHARGFERVAVRRRHVGLGRLTPFVPRGLEFALGRLAGWYLVFEAR